MSNNFLLKTSDFCHLCKTTRETLKWYDEMGILRPQERGENGYRYYSTSQVMEFDFVSSLKGLGCSLEEIKQLQSEKSLSAYQIIIQDKYRVIEDRITQLIRSKRLLESLDKCIIEASSCTFGQPELVELDEELLYMTPYDNSEGYSAINTHIVEGSAIENVIQHPNGLILSKETVLEGTPKIKFYFYVMTKGPVSPTGFRKKGLYVQYYQHGDIETISSALPVVKRFIEEQKLEMDGDTLLYDLLTNFVQGKKDAYVSKILIPVRYRI